MGGGCPELSSLLLLYYTVLSEELKTKKMPFTVKTRIIESCKDIPGQRDVFSLCFIGFTCLFIAENLTKII